MARVRPKDKLDGSRKLRRHFVVYHYHYVSIERHCIILPCGCLGRATSGRTYRTGRSDPI